MRKLASLLVALVMCVSLVACGGDDDSSAPSGGSDAGIAGSSDTGSADGSADSAGVSASGEGDYCSNYDAMNAFEIYVVLPMDRLTAAPWKFTGGYNVSGDELTEEEVEQMRSEAGGEMKIEFVDETTANLMLGEASVAGTYRVLDDGASINFTFGQDTVIEYVGAFTAIGEDETPVLLLTSAGTPNTVLYMT